MAARNRWSWPGADRRSRRTHDADASSSAGSRAGAAGKEVRPGLRATIGAWLLASCAAFAFAGATPAAGQPVPIRPLQDFAANPPGSYALPVIQPAADGWVLEGSRLWPRRLSSYTHGAITLLSFVYTYCTDPVGCPLAYATFVDVRERVLAEPSLRAKVRFVSLSFDPTNDTPAAMQFYGGDYARARELRWHFLTTSSMARLKPILDGFGQDVEVERDAAGRPTRAITHMLKVFLIDPRGQVREVYGAEFLHPEVVFNDILTLAFEADEPSGHASGAQSSPAPPASLATASRTHAPVAQVADSVAAAPVGSRPSDPAFGLPPLRLPAGVVVTPQRVELGRKLFFVRRLSANGTMSCAMCHVPEQGFTSNASRTAVGIEGRSLRRNAPSLLNVAWRKTLFHDGRENSLLSQAWQPLLHVDEMGNRSERQVLDRIGALPDYAGLFERAFDGRRASVETVAAALAAFEATLVSADSRFDRWRYRGDREALDSLEQRGFRIFTGKARCSSCHLVGERNASFTDEGFHATGGGLASRPAPIRDVTLAPGLQARLSAKEIAVIGGELDEDLGRFEVTHRPSDRDAFRTPSLRNVSRSAPYMHDGSIATLEDVVEFYDRGGGESPQRSPLLVPLGLDADDKAALVAFLRSLDGANVDALAAKTRPRPGPATPARPSPAAARPPGATPVSLSRPTPPRQRRAPRARRCRS